jgi:small subunit ribosomal protein S15
MTIKLENRKEIIALHQAHESDTGSPEVQVALLTTRINRLTDHFKINKKDFAGRRGLLKLVSRRRSLLDYLHKKSESRYKELIGKLNIRH